MGLLQEARGPGHSDPDRSGEPGPGRHRRREASQGTRFVTTHKGDQVLDEASLARARSLVGLKGYVTNIPSRLMGAGEVVSSYHELWHVEQSFADEQA